MGGGKKVCDFLWVIGLVCFDRVHVSLGARKALRACWRVGGSAVPVGLLVEAFGLCGTLMNDLTDGCLAEAGRRHEEWVGFVKDELAVPLVRNHSLFLCSVVLVVRMEELYCTTSEWVR